MSAADLNAPPKGNAWNSIIPTAGKASKILILVPKAHEYAMFPIVQIRFW